MTRRDKERYAPWLMLAVILLLWELICRGFGVSEFIFPAPSRIVSQLWEYRGTIAGHAWRTFWVTMVGFGISIVVGTLLGFLIGSSRTAYAAFYPLMTGFNALPKAAFVPILVVWFGIGVGPAVLTAFLISFFPITVNIATGLATLEPELEDVLRVLGAKRWDVLVKVLLRLAQGRDHARLRGHHGLRDDGLERRHRLPAHLGRLVDADGPGLRRPGGHRRDGDDHVRTVRRDREAHDGLGASVGRGMSATSFVHASTDG